MCGRNADWSVTLLGIRAGALVVRTAEPRGVAVRARGVRGAGGGGGGGFGIPCTQVRNGRSQRSQYSSATRPHYGAVHRETIAAVPMYLDLPVDGTEISGTTLHVQGWAHDETSPVRDVMILLDGDPLGRAGLTWPRPDVAEAHGDARQGLCGFDRVVTLPPPLRAPGPHTLSVEVRRLNGQVRRTTPVRVDFPPRPVLPADADVSPRPRHGGGPVHSVWLARSLDRGGSQLRMAETVEHLARRGWTTTVLTPAEGPLRARLEAAGARVRLVEPVPFDDAPRYRASVSRLVDELEGADLAVAPTVTSFPLVHAAALAGVPAVQRIGEEAPLPTVVAWLAGRLDDEVEAYARRAIRGAAAIWTNAHAVEASYRAQGYDGAWSVIHTGRPSVGDLPTRGQARRQLELPLDRRVLVCAGTIWPVKGQGLLTEAARIVRRDHPELLVAMVGFDENPYAAQLRTHIEAHELADTVVVVPFQDDLGAWWAAADAVALTPHSPSEALSSALVEGMAHGLPALASRAGDAAVMVEDGRSGWLCDADDLGSLVDALRRAASADEETLRTYGARAAERCAQEDDREAALARAATLLEECVSAVESAAS
jgi:glycosyltransferase involved in cell wall biosynthesis